MDKHAHSQHHAHTPLFPLAFGWIGLLVVAVGAGAYTYYTLDTQLTRTSFELASTTDTLSLRDATIRTLEESLLAAHGENKNLATNLEGEQMRNNSYQSQIQTLSSTVNDLYKLSTTDKELLQKYSNVYFLNENYIPSALSDIDTAYLQRKDKPEKIHSAVKPFLEALIRDANANNIPLTVLSGYRSFGTQASLKANYKVQYGTTAANKFSADQGYSEHQLGSTVDFTTPSDGEALEKFAKAPAHAWLLANAHRYGFILSYPKDNKFYQSEPWHWRFVGVELATKLHTENRHFYDLDQRETNEYLIKIFN
jgi:LAS superfamily LD-carboxypeptidase LdcB